MQGYRDRLTPGTACSVTPHPQLQQSWRKLRPQESSGVNGGCGQQTGKHLNSRAERQNQEGVFCFRLSACILARSSEVRYRFLKYEFARTVWVHLHRRNLISLLLLEKERKKKKCQLILTWDLPLHLIYLRIHKESFLWGKLRNAPREKALL